MGMEVARASRRTELEFFGIGSVSQAESVPVIMLETSAQVLRIDSASRYRRGQCLRR